MKQIVALTLFIILLSACRNGNSTISKSRADSIVSVSFAYDTTLSMSQYLSDIDKAQKFYESTNDRRGIGNAFIKRAIVLFEAGQTQDVLEQLTKVKPYLSDLDTLRLLTYYRAHAIMLTETGKEPKVAESDMRRAIKLGLERYDVYRAAVDMGNLAELYIRQGRYADAKKALLTMEPYTKGKPAGFQVQRYYCIGLVCLHDGQRDSAYANFTRCYNGAQTWKVPSLEISAVKEMASIDSARGEYRAFAMHYPRYIELRDKVMGRQTVEQINLMKARQSMQQLEMRHKEQERVSNLLLILAVVVTLSLCVLAWQLVRRNKQNQQIARLTREQIENKMHTQSLEKELLELKLKNDKSRIETMQREKASISVQLAAMENSGSEEGKQVRNYARLLENLDPTFAQELERRCPTISKAEIRMASLIRIGMNASEMAQVLHISSSSLYTLRYRLRKRLNLKQDQSLESYIKGVNIIQK